MKKRYLLYITSLLLIPFIALVGCKRPEEPTRNPDAQPYVPPIPQDSTPIPELLQVTSIKFAEVKVDENGELKEADFAEATEFNKGYSGKFYLKEKTETARLLVKVEIPKPKAKQGEQPENVRDFIVYAENANAYLPKNELTRSGDNDTDPFTSTPNKSIALAKGKNSILITIESPEGKKAIYHIIAEYDGGPLKSNSVLIPGVYCPAPRRLSEQEKTDGVKEELLWPIFFASWCHNCPAVLNAAGKNSEEGTGEDIARKYASKGLRVVAIESDKVTDESYSKWVNSGKKYPFYTRDYNCLMGFLPKPSFPFAPCIKEGKIVTKKDEQGNDVPDEYDTRVDKSYEAFIKRVFGL